MESLEVLWCLGASKQQGVKGLEPGDIKVIGEARRHQPPSVEGRSYSRQRGAPVGGAHRLGSPIHKWHRGVAAARRGDGHLGHLGCHIRHVAGNGEGDLVAGGGHSPLQAPQPTPPAPAIPHPPERPPPPPPPPSPPTHPPPPQPPPPPP